MPNVSTPTCFVSMTYGHRLIDWVYDTVKEVAKKRGFAAYRSDERHNQARPVRDIVREEIDHSFMVVVEASGFSWFVGFELFHAIERKLCIVLFLDECLPGTHLDRSARNVFPERWCIPYNLPLEGDGNKDKLLADLYQAFDDVLKQSAMWSRELIEDTLSVVKPKLPRKGKPIFPNVKLNAGPEGETDADALFPTWCRPGTSPKRIVITGPPGSGKTVLLSRFVEWLAPRHSSDPKDIGDLSPIPVYLTTTAMPEELSADKLWQIVVKRVYDVESGVCAVEHPRLLVPYCKAGLVYILFDGLDEFGTRRRGQARELLQALDGLVEKGVNVILTCRKTYWEQQL